MALVRLYFKSVSEILQAEDVGLLILVNEEKTRQLSVICDAAMKYQFGLRVSKADITPQLLPEVLWQVVKRNLDLRFQLIINDIIDGKYRSLLYMPDILQAIPIRISDGVLLAYLADFPIYIDEQLLMRQGVPYDDSQTRVSVPVNIISNEMLQEALERAVSEEDYKKASQIRDELRRREKKDDKISDDMVRR